MTSRDIYIKGARTHNLKNIDLAIPRDKLVVITGISGSGKSSVAFDTLYAEGQRRYVESLSSYARQFLSIMEKPEVDTIEGLSPAISIQQKSASHNPRSTVGTITEIYDYLRLLFARIGVPRCPDHNINLEAKEISEIVDSITKELHGKKIQILAPYANQKKGEYIQLFKELSMLGFIRFRVDGNEYLIEDIPALKRNSKHDIDVIVDRLTVSEENHDRINDSIETAVNLTDGVIKIISDDNVIIHSTNLACPYCSFSIDELEPRLFSFNSPTGACHTCDGLGTTYFIDEEKVVINAELSIKSGAIRGWDKKNLIFIEAMQGLSKHFKFSLDLPFLELSQEHKYIVLYGTHDVIKFETLDRKGQREIKKSDFEGIIPSMERRYRETDSMAVRMSLSHYRSLQDCRECEGSRLNNVARNIFINKRSIVALSDLNVDSLFEFFSKLKLSGWRFEVGSKIIKEITNRLQFLNDVGLSYLAINRKANTLSGGEAQRIRLASQIGSGLVGVMYILDEPSIGLHQRDNKKLINTLKKLQSLGNTVIIVEHDEEMMLSADHIIDIGPGAGRHGGEVVAFGTPEEIKNNKNSLTGKYLSHELSIKSPPKKDVSTSKFIHVKKASKNNLKAVDVQFPVGAISCVTGVSGSGKSTLVNDILLESVENFFADKKYKLDGTVEGFELLTSVINISQSPIGRTPRSNPATYTGIFSPIRNLFALTQDARARGYKSGRFSFNVKGGRCESCEGAGLIKVEMHFLADIYVPCDVCRGKKYNRETLSVKYKNKSIKEVLDLTVEEALDFFENIPSIRNKLKTLDEVGLSYIQLGQNATTLSGGEAQRVKLSKELSKRSQGSTLYILDEPTTGLHFDDVKKLIGVLVKLRDQGNTIIIIEHNIDVIRCADWIVDLGPEGGDKGGEVLYQGDYPSIFNEKKSYTARYL
jgi:excinuclease ABC subunit A